MTTNNNNIIQMACLPLAYVFILAVTTTGTTHAFAPPPLPVRSITCLAPTFQTLLFRTIVFSSTPSDNGSDDDDDQADTSGEGANLAAELFQMAQAKGIQLNDEDLQEEEFDLDDEEEEDDDDDEEEEPNIPQGAINAFLGYDTGDVGDKLKGNVSLTDDQLYSEVKERVLDTAGGFVALTRGADSDEDDDDNDNDDTKPKDYQPLTTFPDPEFTAGEVVLAVLEALNHNDNPSPNYGTEVLFGFSSPNSSIKQEAGLTPKEYAEFLKETEYKVLFQHDEVTIDKGDYSFDGKKAFFTARLRVGAGPLDVVPVNFILSSSGVSDESCWLVDSMLIRPQSMRRRRRK